MTKDQTDAMFQLMAEIKGLLENIVTLLEEQNVILDQPEDADDGWH